VLGPLLFLIYMNDIANALPGVKIKLFADDTNLFIFDKDSKLVCTKATDCLNKLHRWLVANRLTLNLTKTCYMVISYRKTEDIKLSVNDREIQRVNFCKYLGIYIQGGP